MEIKKLADVVVWFDNWIEETKLDLTEEEMEDDETIKEFETIKKVILESIERHNVYTSALNNDIADKAAKIDLLEKEIEGRKEGYVALKELMDTKYISIDEHNNICEEFKKKIVKLEKESEKWQDLAKMNRDTICNQYDVCEEFKNKIAELEEKIRHQRENLDGINKTLEIRTKENESLIAVRNNLNKEIKAHESENARLTEKIMKLKDTITDLSHTIDDYKSWNTSLHKDIKELKKKDDDHGRKGFEEYIKYIISEEEGKFKAELDKRLSEEVSKISQKRTEEELAKVKLNDKFGVGGIADEFKDDIPCGEDAIE